LALGPLALGPLEEKSEITILRASLGWKTFFIVDILFLRFLLLQGNWVLAFKHKTSELVHLLPGTDWGPG
jgi:hypothetical protein